MLDFDEFTQMDNAQRLFLYILTGKKGCITCQWLIDLKCRSAPHIKRLEPVLAAIPNFEVIPKSIVGFEEIGSKCDDWELVKIEETW